jgi:ABC-2 type transport system permease protein
VVYWELAKKNYSLYLQYRLSHVINNLGSCIFGFVYMAIWAGVLAGKEHVSPYKAAEMFHYIGFTQCLLWISAFSPPGLGIQLSVRSGAISMEMARPVSFYWMKISQEAGRIAYNILYRSLPIALVFALTVGFHLPTEPGQAAMAAVSVLLAAFIGMNMGYFVGILSCWTVEIRWAHLTYSTLLFGLGGQLVPIDLLPGVLAEITPYLPFAGVLYYPTMIWLGNISPAVIAIQVAWCAILCAWNLWVTRLARTKLEIQGG